MLMWRALLLVAVINTTCAIVTDPPLSTLGVNPSLPSGTTKDAGKEATTRPRTQSQKTSVPTTAGTTTTTSRMETSDNSPPTQDCIDLVDFCEQLKPVCIGTIIVDQLNAMQAVADAIDQSTALPALQSALPDSDDSETSTTNPLSKINQTVIENSLPLIKESLPLIRESLPLIRESLPLIRQFLDPVYYSGDSSTCQKKVTCKSCRECPKLRDAVTSLIETICPATCRVCGKAPSGTDAATNLVNFYL